jgi:N utilization substance protein A
MRGARVKNIVRELNNEKVDILEWTEDPVTFVREALSPVEPREITVDEEARKIFVIVQDDKDRPQGPECPPHLPPDGLGCPGARL